MNKKLFSTLVATSTLTSGLLAMFPEVATAGASFIDACKQPGTDSALVYYSHDGVVSSIAGELNSDNGKIRRTRVRNRLKNRRGLTESEANNVKDSIPTTTISSLPLCSISQFPFYRGADDPTAFHSISADGKTGADVFQQFSNTESSALDLDTLNARKLDISKLELTYDNEVKIYFINEGAGYKNQLQISTTGTDVKSGMVFTNVSCHNSDSDCAGPWGPWDEPSDTQYALKAGDYVDIGTLGAGTKLDFQVIADGSTYSSAYVWHTDTSLNSDGLQHVIAYDYEGYLVLGWEDIKDGGDMDYNDVVFAVYVGEDNLSEIPTDAATNNAPVAVDDAATTPYNRAVTVDALANDSDPDGEAISLSAIASDPSNGSVSISGDTVVYTPNSGFSGTDTFEYTIADGQGATATATATVTVASPIPAPSCPVGSTVTLTGTIRDFSHTHPDFQYRVSPGGNVEPGIVKMELGSDRKPIYADHPSDSTHTTNGKVPFDQWYRDVPGINESMDYSIDLVKDSSGKFRYENRSFFPIDNQLMGNEYPGNDDHNFHFTYELHSQFTYKGGEVLNFSGDDDVWVYINGYRVIDLGGVHAKQDASVDIDEIATAAGITKGNTYDFDFFFAERHTTESNFILETSLDLLCDTDGDGISDLVEGGEDTDGDGIANYQDEDSDGNGILDSEEGSQDTDGDGIADFLDTDNDNNGVDDINDSTDDGDGDGILDYQDADDDNDGIDDVSDDDVDGNGVDDVVENSPTFPFGFTFPFGGSADDIDGDGIQNSIDADNDGDGISDEDEENGHYDLDGDGDNDITTTSSTITYEYRVCGVLRTITRPLPSGFDPNDLNGDGVPNYLDPNDDGDDLDAIEEREYNDSYGTDCGITTDPDPTTPGGDPDPDPDPTRPGGNPDPCNPNVPGCYAD